jgi:glycosyltransferase involved in cell wall biosynthesis
MKLAVLTPLPPARSGVAHYASLLLPALSERAEVRAFDSLDGYRRSDYDAVIYQLGNNPHHEVMLAEAMREPGVVVLHDLVLHHLIVEMTLARGDLDGYVATLEASHGAAGAAWAYGRAAGMHTEMANFLMPASIDVARRSTAVIVHNHYARERLLSFGVETPIHVVPHPYVPETRTFDRDALRAGLGFAPDTRVIGFFGFLTSAKRAEVVLEAFRIAREREPRLALLIVGEPAPNIDLATLQADGVVTTGYVADDDFGMYYAAADRFVNLRYPTAGETSGTLIRALDAGKPVAVSDYAQFAELPDDCVVKIPLGAGEVERVADFFLRDLPDPSRAQRAWLEQHATLAKTVDGYMDALGGGTGVRSVPLAPMAVFPELEVVAVDEDAANIHVTIRNRGPYTIRTRTYGEREYRLIAKLFDGDVAVQDRWLSLPRDLAPGETATLTFPRRAAGSTLRLYHALQDVPMLEPEAWAEVRDVR